MAAIEDLLHRRTDLSTFVVHFTRPTIDPPLSATENLVSILSGLRIEARTAYGMAKQLAERFPAVAAAGRRPVVPPGRHRGGVRPEGEHRAIRQQLQAAGPYHATMPAVVDAQWGLERMIGELADVLDIGPFPN